MKNLFFSIVLSLAFLISCSDDPASPNKDSFLTGTWKGMHKGDTDSTYMSMTIKNEQNIFGIASVFVKTTISGDNIEISETLEQIDTFNGTFSENELEIKFTDDAQYIFKGILSADSTQFVGHINIKSTLAEDYLKIDITLKKE